MNLFVILLRICLVVKTIYIYDNPYTGECIESEDDSLLETLNAKPKAKKKRRERDVKTINVTFNFNIKKK